MLGVFSLPEPVTFRPGFLWGSATAGHQIEGGNIHSHKYRMELDGKFPECSGKACNFRELYRQDIDLLAELGHQAFRLSLEWPRIEPAPGVHDEAEMKWYLQVLELLKEKKIRICATLMHLSHPQWFEEMGEFHRRENVDYFLRHLEYLVPQVAPYADSWIVLNEFNGSEDPRCVERKVNCLVAHARAAELIWDDPLLGILYDDYKRRDPEFDLNLLERYEEMLCKLLPYQEDAAAGDFEHIVNALELLIRKLELRGALEAAYDQDDRIALRQIAVSMVPATIAAMQEFDASFRRQWLDCGKVFGLEVIQRRNAGLIARLEETALRIREYLDDRISAIDELDARPSGTGIVNICGTVNSVVSGSRLV